MNVTLLGLLGGDTDRFMTVFNDATKDGDATIARSATAIFWGDSFSSEVRSSRFSVGPIAHTYENAISCFHDHYLSLLKGPADVLNIKTG
jgi:hypothetical protein